MYIDDCQYFGIPKEIKSRKIFVSTGHLAALAPEAVQGLKNMNFTQPMTHNLCLFGQFG